VVLSNETKEFSYAYWASAESKFSLEQRDYKGKEKVRLISIDERFHLVKRALKVGFLGL